ncbi:MAG: hydrogenase expression/formation protein HypE [Desulfobulbaceae bacterium]|uniref:Hydrogenase expression/formation protein HypE n=1 Tax=Candidatus Desulfatifera sulfidica TaxID=2841691 RepID=A0A8J6NAZ9_9BACT|nr:hydrogenase expression/formation protein HypE [Candidatus Desulfatifera sulfidica]
MSPETILLDHGSGGLASQQLISSLFLKYLDHPVLAALEDSAVIQNGPGRLALTTDSYVVDPLFFPGGDIGSMAVHGTINDLAMRGARPLGLTLALILEEGLEMAVLERVIASVARACKESGVPVLSGDTKVVPRGKADKLFINTSGVGLVADDIELASRLARPGDKIILSGTMGDHGLTIMASRAGLALGGNLQSDSMALHHMVADLLAGLKTGSVHVLRDPTRGGVATVLGEIARAAGCSVEINEAALPLRPEVRGGCELLGLDPLYLANEGKLLAVVAPEVADAALELLQAQAGGGESAIIGTVGLDRSTKVTMQTVIGGTRIITPLHGEPLPRIC